MTPAEAVAVIPPEDRLASTTALALASRIIATIPDPDGRRHAGIMASLDAVYEMQMAVSPYQTLDILTALELEEVAR